MIRKIIVAGLVLAAVFGLLALFVDVIPPKAETITAMGETFVRIGLYAKQSNSISPSLAVLPKRNGYANQTTDAWGRELKYEVTPDGVISLTSLGKDGKPGGQGDDADIRRAYFGKRSDGALWATSEMWIVEAEIREKGPQQSAAPLPPAPAAQAGPSEGAR
jgi:hypothetical protein